MSAPVLAATEASHSPGWLAQLALVLVAAAAIGYVASRLKVVPIVAFLAAGVVIGPEQTGFVDDLELVNAAAEVGVILLLFTIGIEFSLERLARIMRLILVGGGLQVGLTVAATTGALLAFGVDWRAAVFTGFLLALSSTAIVLKLLADRGQTSAPTGQISLALLIFQDLAVVVMVLLTPILAGGGGSPLDLLWALTKAVGIIAVVLLGARRVMPMVLATVARTCSVEVFLLTVVAVCFGTAYLTSLAGVSVSLGAFLAGLLVSESEHSEHAFGEVLPLQILFSATFFVSVGMLLDVGFLLTHLPMVLGAILAVLVLKVVTGALAARVVGASAGTALASAFLVAQVGEFSFVLQRVGADNGLFPAGLGDDGAQAFIAATVLLMVATPWLGAGGMRLGERLDRKAVAAAPAPSPGTATPTEDDGLRAGHVVISGWGPAAAAVAAELSARGHDFTVLTLSPDGAATARELGYDVLLGDSTRQHILTTAGVPTARAFVVGDDDPETSVRIASVARSLAPGLTILVRPDGPAEHEALAAAGADHVVDAGLLSHARLAGTVAGLLDPTAGQRPRRTVVDVTRLLTQPPASPDCAHAGGAGAVLPDAAGCSDCLRLGRDDWVHLRACLACGHVGCCDSSPMRHATAHFRASDHPLMASVEPGDAWAWCYVDEVTLETPAVRAATRAP